MGRAAGDRAVHPDLTAHPPPLRPRAEATALHPHAIELPARPADARPATRGPARGPCEEAGESEENPGQIRHLTIVPVAALDLPSMRALAYAASLRQPVLAVHISPTEEEAERFRDYWEAWGDHLPLEVIVSPHRAIVAPLVNYIAVAAPAAARADTDGYPPGDRRTALVAPHPAQPGHCGSGGRCGRCRRSSSPPSLSTSGAKLRLSQDRATAEAGGNESMSEGSWTATA